MSCPPGPARGRARERRAFGERLLALPVLLLLLLRKLLFLGALLRFLLRFLLDLTRFRHGIHLAFGIVFRKRYTTAPGLSTDVCALRPKIHSCGYTPMESGCRLGGAHPPILLDLSAARVQT